MVSRKDTIMIPAAYHRSLLTEEEQADYLTIANALIRHSSRVQIKSSAAHKKSIKRIISAVHLDHPELFFVDFWNSKVISSSLCQGSAILFNMLIDRKTADSITETINNRVSSIREKDSPSLSAKKRYMILMNEIASSTKYKNTASAFWDHTVAGPILYHTAVCEAIAKLFLLLCQRLDLPCAVITGTVNDAPHAWNMVELSGRRYYVDVTYHLKVIPIYIRYKLFPDSVFKTREQMISRGYLWIKT